MHSKLFISQEYHSVLQCNEHWTATESHGTGIKTKDTMGALLFSRTKKVHRIASPRGILHVNNNTACHVRRLCDCLHSGVSIRHCLMFIDTVTGGGFILEGREEEEICMHNLTVGTASKQGAGEHTQRAYSVSVHSRCDDAANYVQENKHLRLSTAHLSTFSFIFNF